VFELLNKIKALKSFKTLKYEVPIDSSRLKESNIKIWIDSNHRNNGDRSLGQDIATGAIGRIFDHGVTVN